MYFVPMCVRERGRESKREREREKESTCKALCENEQEMKCEPMLWKASTVG